jgi:ABC-type transport system involved in multi-copper enzyme maturation permease subunit
MVAMWAEIFRFEIKYHLRQPLFYVSSLVFFALAGLLTSTRIGPVLGDAPASVHVDAPILIAKYLTIFALLALFVITAFVASSALRDFERGTHMLFFSKPIRKFDYLIGRFCGSVVVALLVMLITALGLIVGGFMPWQSPDRLGGFRADTYLYALGVLVLPNLLAMGAAFFALASWSRRLLVAFLGVVFVLIAQDVIEELAGGLENGFLGSVIEPTGLVALETMSRYWTAAEFDTALPELGGAILLNRVLWLLVGAALLAVAYWRFDYARAAGGRKKTKKAKAAREEEHTTPRVVSLVAATRSFSTLVHWRQWLRQTSVETTQVLRGIPFIVLLIFAVVFVFTFALLMGENRGVASYPLTYLMLRGIAISMQMFLVAVIIFYSGELVWRERAINLDGIYDSLPAPSWVFLGAKLSTLVLVVGVFLAAGAASTILVQLFKGYTNLELGLYLRGMLVTGYPYVSLAVLAVFLQVVSPSKFLGYLLTILVILARRGARDLGLEHNLVLYGGHTSAVYSDMNGYGHYAEPFFWFCLYWSFAAAILVVLAAGLWRRGSESAFRGRLALARQRLRGKALAVLVLAAVAFAATGGYIFYNTNIVNDYMPRNERIRKLVSYEKKYSEYRNLPLPHIASVKSRVDIYPSARRVEIEGSYRLVNRSGQPIRVIPVSLGHRIDPHEYLPFNGHISVKSIDLPPHRTTVSDGDLGFHVYELEESLAPGDSLEMGFQLVAENRGFRNSRHDDRLVGNGTFVSNKNVFPVLGYVKASELQSPGLRRKNDLPPHQRAASVDDEEALQSNYLHADWTQYETVVSTSADQIAVAPGHLEREWTEGGRRFFHYKTQAPVIDLAVFVSARFEVRRDFWDDVEIRIFHHPEHAFNIERMLEAAKHSLEYFTAEFGPYPHNQLRILEVPNYIGLTAMSLAETIPFSESWGFTSRIGERDLDMVTYVTAHEVSHQWWNHQVIPGDVQGATFISETLSQYSALMVMERIFGADHVREFLKWELDQYLEGRSRERLREMPLVLVENQPYIHYNKGSLIMYALRDYIGEDAVNSALRRFLEAQAFRGPPYVNSLELLRYLSEVTPPQYAHLIEDMFQTITLFDNRVAKAVVSEQENGEYLVRIEVVSRKLRADGRGVETAIPVDDWIDVGVFGEAEDGSETVLFLEKRRITATEQVFEIVVKEPPNRVGIDPYNKLVDRDSNDNVKSVSQASG